MVDWAEGFVAVDWGTTNRRAYLLDADGAVTDRIEDELGVTGVAADGFAEAVAALSARFGGKPMLLAGMVGSNRGWHEAAYVRCPADPAELSRHLLWVEDGVAIVPGLSIVSGRHGDVMRGEEVQLFGLMRLDRAAADATVCHPGTHSKWVRLQAGQIIDFRTVMTGELFNLLREHSILAPLLQGPVDPGEPFLAGVAAGYGGAVPSAELFAVRARVLLAMMAERDAAPYVSGLLIGCDLRAGLAMAQGSAITVLGRPSLTRLYAAAIEHCGWQAREVDGAAAFVAGMQSIRETIA